MKIKWIQKPSFIIQKPKFTGIQLLLLAHITIVPISDYFLTEWQSSTVVAETTTATKSKTFILWPFWKDLLTLAGLCVFLAFLIHLYGFLPFLCKWKMSLSSLEARNFELCLQVFSPSFLRILNVLYISRFAKLKNNEVEYVLSISIALFYGDPESMVFLFRLRPHSFSIISHF